MTREALTSQNELLSIRRQASVERLGVLHRREATTNDRDEGHPAAQDRTGPHRGTTRSIALPLHPSLEDDHLSARNSEEIVDTDIIENLQFRIDVGVLQVPNSIAVIHLGNRSITFRTQITSVIDPLDIILHEAPSNSRLLP